MNIPKSPAAYLFDLDGVLVDSLQLDIDICTPILQKYHPDIVIPDELIYKNFAYAFPKFWRNILNELEIKITDELLDHCVTQNEQLRSVTTMKLLPGVLNLLQKNQKNNTTQAVVSNNSEKHIIEILENSDISQYFQHIVGNDAHRIK
jgi:beta-phosphoglucomutase-like phosphatase (HAD superfamily)